VQPAKRCGITGNTERLATSQSVKRSPQPQAKSSHSHSHNSDCHNSHSDCHSVSQLPTHPLKKKGHNSVNTAPIATIPSSPDSPSQAPHCHPATATHPLSPSHCHPATATHPRTATATTATVTASQPHPLKKRAITRSIQLQSTPFQAPQTAHSKLPLPLPSSHCHPPPLRACHCRPPPLRQRSQRFGPRAKAQVPHTVVPPREPPNRPVTRHHTSRYGIKQEKKGGKRRKKRGSQKKIRRKTNGFCVF
jgi:hypothetical protein